MRFLQSIGRYTAVLPASCKQFIECRVRSTAIKHTSGHVAFWPQPVGSLPLAQNAWHCTSNYPRYMYLTDRVDTYRIVLNVSTRFHFIPWPRGTFAFFVRGSRFVVICASRFSFVLRGSRFALRGSRFAVICASHFTFVLRGSRFLIRGSYFLVPASQFAVRSSWFVVRGGFGTGWGLYLSQIISASY